jgi:hypothetical protein
MNTPQHLPQFLTEAHACAMQMMENATYIQKQLPALDMPDSLRIQIEKLCLDLIGTTHDVIHEIHELDEFMASTPYQIEPWMERIRGWIMKQVTSLDQCVQAVNESVTNGTANSLVLMLVMESAANILNEVPTFPTIPEDTETESEQDDAPEDEDDAPDDGCYGFYSEDSYPVGQLIDAIRNVMDRPELSPETLEQLRVFLFAMERLPLVTPGVRMGVALRLDQGGESDWREIRMEDGEFTLGCGTWTDGDADTETVFEVGPGYRDGDAFQASNFALSFLSCAEDVCREVVIDDSSDEPFNGWDLEKDKSLWSSLPCSFL